MGRPKAAAPNSAMRLARVAAAARADLSVVATAVPASSASSAPAHQSRFPRTNGRIAYCGDDGNDHEIYTIRTDGGGRRQLTDNTTDGYDVDWGVAP
jgi:hypothetical protein